VERMVEETVVEVTVAEGMAAVMTEAREVLVVPGALVAVGCKWQSLLRTTGYARTAC
jgi:NAD/NADP transhydrogenase beta subunit